MSSRAIAIGSFVVARGLDRRGERGDERAVVRRVGQRIAPGRLDELIGLAADPRLRRPEHEEQHERRDAARP